MSLKEEECPYSLNLTKEEVKALGWLQHILAERMETPSSEISRMAYTAHKTIGRALKKLEEFHLELHAKDEELDQAEMLVAGLLSLPRSMGLVKDEDLN